MASDVEKPEFEDREEADRPGADDHDVGLDGLPFDDPARALVRHLNVIPAGPAS